MTFMSIPYKRMKNRFCTIITFEMWIKHWLEGEIGMNMEKMQFIWDYLWPTFIIPNDIKKMF
jgi:hypothetical protein